MDFKVLLQSVLILMIFVSYSKEGEVVALSAETITGRWKLAPITCDIELLTREYIRNKLTSTFKVSSKDHNAAAIFGENINTFKTIGSYIGITKTNFSSSLLVAFD